MSKRPGAHLWIPCAVVALTATIYLPALTFGFVCDDAQQIVWSQGNLRWQVLPGYFTSDVWSYISPTRTNYYRPIFMLWLMINYNLFGLDTMLWHLSAIFAHLAATLLFYFLARRLVGDPVIAGAAALLFGVHPAHVEAVAWISGATESLFATGAFATILCHLRWREESRTHRRLLWEAASLSLFAVVMLTKETGIILPLFLFACEWLLPLARHDSTGVRLRHAVWMAFPYAVIVLFYLPLRIHVLGSFAPLTRHWQLATVLTTLPFALQFYLRQLLLPVQYSLFYPIAPIRQADLSNFLLPLLIVAVAAAALIWISLRSRIAGLGAILLVLPIVPVLNLRAFAFEDYLHDRYLYVSLAGFSLLVALGIQQLSRDQAPVRIALLFTVTAVLAAVTVRASRPWHDNLSLYTHAIEAAPENTVAQMYYGGELVEQKRFADALPVLKTALAGDLRAYYVYNQISHCYAELGQLDEAASYLHDAIVITPQFPEAYLNLGMLELRRGRFADAENHVRQALRLRRHNSANPVYDRYHYCLGSVLEAKGDLEGALAEYRVELGENAGAEDVHDRILDLQTRLRIASQ